MILNMYNFRLYHPDDGGDGGGGSEFVDPPGEGEELGENGGDSTRGVEGGGYVSRTGQWDPGRGVPPHSREKVNEDVFGEIPEDEAEPWLDGEIIDWEKGTGRDKKSRRRRTLIKKGAIKPEQSKIARKKIITEIFLNGKPFKKTSNIPAGGDNISISIVGRSGCLFSLTITDSSGNNMLNKKIEWVTIPEAGYYSFIQEFPSIESQEGGTLTNQTYNINITTGANTKLGDNISIATPTFRLFQFARPTLTFTNTASSTFTITGSDVAKTGQAGEYINAARDYSKLTYNLAVKYASYSSGRIYVKSKDFNSNIIKGNIIKGIVHRQGETGLTNSYYFTPSSHVSETTIEGGAIVKTDIPVGARVNFLVQEDKVVKGSLDEDGNIIDFDKTKKNNVKKFKLSNTNNLSKGMIMYGDTIAPSSVESIDSIDNITLLENNEIFIGETLSFIRRCVGTVVNVDNNVSPGKIQVIFDKRMDIPHGTEVSFDDDYSVVKGSMTQTGSGKTGNGDANDIDLAITIDVQKIGSKDVTYTLNLDNIITTKPNAYDQDILISKNSSGFAINMIKNDHDTNAASKTGVVTQNPTHGSVGSWNASNDTFTYTPNNGYTGRDSFKFQMKDDQNTLSEEKIIRITIK